MDPLLALLVKGDLAAAQEACEARGIPVDGMLHLKHHQTRIYAPIGFLSSALQWFAERREIVPGYGYPDGTLLWYHVPEWIAPEKLSPSEVTL